MNPGLTYALIVDIALLSASVIAPGLQAEVR
jgi:hypothetical protein